MFVTKILCSIEGKIKTFSSYFVLLVTHKNNMVHWQTEKFGIVLIIFSSLHFNLIRSDCSAHDWSNNIEQRSHCEIDGNSNRKLNGRRENRLDIERSVDRLKRQSEYLWPNDLNRRRKYDTIKNIIYILAVHIIIQF